MGVSGEIIEQLRRLGGGRTLIVGVGNTLKGDDGVGPLICQAIEGKVCAEVVDTATVPENYIQQIVRKAPDGLLVVDAVDFASEAGAVRVFESEQLASVAWSTHTLSPRLFVEMVQGEIEIQVLFLGIQPGQCRFGQGLSEEVEGTFNAVVEALVEVFGRQ